MSTTMNRYDYSIAGITLSFVGLFLSIFTPSVYAADSLTIFTAAVVDVTDRLQALFDAFATSYPDILGLVIAFALMFAMVGFFRRLIHSVF